MTKRIAGVQKAYLIAKANLEIAHAALKAVETAGTSDTSRDRFDTPEYQKFSSAFQALADAENALIRWGESKVKHMPGYTAQVADLFHKVVTYEVGPELRRQIIDMTMKLSA